jgi:hypothetical protein
LSGFLTLIVAQHPKELPHIVQRAGGVWEPGSRRWLVERRRIVPLIKALERRATDPLVRRVEMALDLRPTSPRAELGRVVRDEAHIRDGDGGDLPLLLRIWHVASNPCCPVAGNTARES